MKRLIFILILTLSISAYSQRNITWIFASGSGAYGTSFFFNEASLNDDNISYNYYSPSYYFGGRFGFIFGETTGIVASIYKNTMTQGYIIENNSSTQNVNASIGMLQYDVMLLVQSETGFYFNVGPEFAKVKSAILNVSGATDNQYDIMDKITPNLTGLSFKMGIKPLRTDLIELNLGVTGTYFFSSLISQSGYILPLHDRTFYNPAITDEKTFPVQLGINLELVYTFARYGRASCGKNRIMINTF